MRRILIVFVFVLWCAAACGRDRSTGSRVVEEDAGVTMCGAPRATVDGWPCACDTDCREGSFCNREDGDYNIPGGMCMYPCPMGTECLPGTVCVRPRTISGAGVCMPSCVTNADCPPTRSCSVDEGETSGHCVPICGSDADCPVTGVCNRWIGRCIDTPDGALPQESCVRNEDCASLLCVASYGECGSWCSISRQTCPEPFACIGLSESDDVGICARKCEIDADCADLPDATCYAPPVPAGVTICI